MCFCYFFCLLLLFIYVFFKMILMAGTLYVKLGRQLRSFSLTFGLDFFVGDWGLPGRFHDASKASNDAQRTPRDVQGNRPGSLKDSQDPKRL